MLICALAEDVAPYNSLYPLVRQDDTINPKGINDALGDEVAPLAGALVSII